LLLFYRFDLFSTLVRPSTNNQGVREPFEIYASPRSEMENAFAKSTSEVLEFFSVSEARGLTEAQVRASREKYGSNGK
jgi:magnesium-transporting ATPase (P-type)